MKYTDSLLCEPRTVGAKSTEVDTSATVGVAKTMPIAREVIPAARNFI
jgi:hypothetical protein